MNNQNKISLEEDIKLGKVTINENGHISRLQDYDYARLLKGWESENSTCYLCGQKMLYKMTRKDGINHIEGISWTYATVGTRRVLNEKECSMIDHKKQEGAFKISVPTGELIIGNYFLDKDGEFAFDVPKKSRWIEKYNICNIKGQNNRADYVSEKFNVGYVQMNSPIEVWRSKDKNKIIFIMGPSRFENKLSKEDKKFNKDFEKSYKYIAELDQRVWRYEFADKLIVCEHQAEVSQEYEHLTVKVPKGRYVVKHHYGKMYFRMNNKRYVIVTEIELNTSSREVLTEKSKQHAK